MPSPPSATASMPDMITFAKGITSGSVPMGGVIVKKAIYDAFMRGPEHVVELFHGYTYSAHPLACAAGLATLDLYREEDLFERAKKLEPVWADAAMSAEGSAERARHPHASGSPPASISPRRPDAVGRRAYDAMVHAFNDERHRGARDRRHHRPHSAADRQRKPYCSNIREGRTHHSRCSLTASGVFAPCRGT